MFPWLRALVGGGNPGVVLQNARAASQYTTALDPAPPYNTGVRLNVPHATPMQPQLPGQGQIAPAGWLGRFGGVQALGPSMVVDQASGPSYYSAPATWMRGAGPYTIPMYRNTSSAPGYAGMPNILSVPESLDTAYLAQLYPRPSGG